MHAALITNTAWLDEELTMFRQLIVGLLDEQVRVLQVVPDRLPDHDASAFGQRLSWSDSSYGFLRKFRIGRLAEQIKEQDVDILHALDGRLWEGALVLAQALNLPVVLGASSMLDVPLAGKIAKKLEPLRAGIAAATEPLAEAIKEHVGRETVVQVIPHGVHVPERLPRDDKLSMGIAIAGSGVYDSDYDVLFQALGPFLREHPQTQIFSDSQVADQHRLWSAADRYGLLSNMTLVPRRLGHREILMSTNALLHPQPLGKARGLVLQAMAHGIPVIAKQDPWLDYLIDGQTAWLVADNDPQSWTAALRRLAGEPQAARDLGASARQWVHARHLPSQQVALILDLYRRVTGEPIKFPQAGG